jgi:tRNA dimethylallyltransferase
MDIGTAKPTQAEQSQVPHHLLDIVNPDERFTAADFKARALMAIEDITSRRKLPIMVGGTGLYVDAVLYDYSFRPPVSAEERAKWEALSVEELQQALKDKGIALPNNPQNPRHLVRTLETSGVATEKKALRSNTLVIGFEIENKALLGRIQKRTDEMLEAGLQTEAAQLGHAYGWQSPGMSAIGYREWQLPGEEVREAIVKDTKDYAKRQKTWFKRNKSIHWISDVAEGVAIVTTFLNKSTQ